VSKSCAGLIAQSYAHAYGPPVVITSFSLQQPLTVLQMPARISAAAAVVIEPTVLGGAASEIPAQHLDAAAARSELGRRPRIGLDESLRHTAGWYRRFLRAGDRPR
jgi:nucleoside-diphosphate-sugar epimerase